MSGTPHQDAIQLICSRLKNVRAAGDSEWIARCPAHDDKRPSLSIGLGDDRRILLHCHAGCETKDILKVLRLEFSDLYPSKASRKTRTKRKIIATYDYRDVDGELVFQVVRYEPKSFRQRRPDGDEGWHWNLKGVGQRPLYRLPELLKADTNSWVFITEGEKDADRIVSLSLVATTNPGGAGKWSKVDDTPLHGRRVAIIPDNDEPGRRHSEQVAKALCDKVAKIKVVELPGLPEGGDLSDWLSRDGTRKRLLHLAEDAHAWNPIPQEENAETSIIPNSIDVLGMDEERRVVIWSNDTRHLWFIPKLREIDRPTLIQIAGQAAINDGADMSQIRAAIAEASRRHVFRPEDMLGQGIWRVKGRRGVLVVVGNRAVRVMPIRRNQDLPIKEIHAPLIRNKLILFNRAEKWINLDVLMDVAQKIGPAVGKQVWDCLCDRLAAWEFAGDSDQKMLAGLILATPFQAVLPFRPQVWITGATNTGKTALFTFLGRLWPLANELDGETTEAAIRQEIRCSSRPVLVDEFEQWPGRRRIIKLARTATRGGTVVKGTPGGKPLRFPVRHMFWFASVDVSLTRAVDRNRFLTIELEPSDRIYVPSADEAKDLGVVLIAAMLTRIDDVVRLWEQLSTVEEFRSLGRLVEVYALPVAVQACFVSLSSKAAEELLRTILTHVKGQLTDQFVPDHEDLLTTILSSRIDAVVPVKEGRYGADKKLVSIGDLLRLQRYVGWGLQRRRL